MGFEKYLHLTEQWLMNHGFQLSNRELASLAWLVLIAIIGLSLLATKPGPRHQLAGILQKVFLTKLTVVWTWYLVCIGLFVCFMDAIGFWRPTLTKATFVWAATGGIVSLVGFVQAQSLSYFKSAVRNLLRGTIVAEYFIGFVSFPFVVEFFLQPAIFFVAVAPTIDSEAQEMLNRIRFWFFSALVMAMIAWSGLAILSTWDTLDWGLILRQIALPVLLGAWVLVFVLPLSIYSSYEMVFNKIEIFRNDRVGLWKAKIGVVLALRHHLKYVREAEKGGAEITRAARADTVGAAYREARKLVDE